LLILVEDGRLSLAQPTSSLSINHQKSTIKNYRTAATSKFSSNIPAASASQSNTPTSPGGAAS
jgi:hypothetical protein